MATIEGHPNGKFCWFELATDNQEAAKAFYRGLFSWTAADFPMEGQTCTTFRLDGRDVGAAVTLSPEQRRQGVPPHWGIYVAVESADAAASKAAQLGAAVMLPPFDVFDLGRMAVMQDPTGAVFRVWQSRRHKGTGIAGVPGTVCWCELTTNDAGRAISFYESLFGWERRGKPDYAEMYNGEQGIGGIMTIQPGWGPMTPAWSIYVAVSQVENTVAKAVQLGGAVPMSPTSLPGVGRIATLADGQGAQFHVIEPEPRRAN